jgi:hypothetical protein
MRLRVVAQPLPVLEQTHFIDWEVHDPVQVAVLAHHRSGSVLLGDPSIQQRIVLVADQDVVRHVSLGAVGLRTTSER